MDSPAEAKPIPPLQRHLQLETDLFCHACGYNLHGQTVTRDERLDILICRCPECGKFHPAEMGVSATRPWMARMGVMLIAVWVLALLFVLGFGGFLTGACANVHVGNYTERTWTGPGNRTMIRRMTTPLVANVGLKAYEHWESQWITFVLSDVCLSIALGAFTAIATWHLSSTKRLIFLALPVLVAPVVLWSITSEVDDNSEVLGYIVRVIAMYTVLSAAMIVVGQVIGRPIARFMLKLLIPPKLRQHVNFLWTCDGKTPPGVAA